MPRASAADAELTARRILHVATRQFGDRSFPDVSLEGIAQEAAVTRGAVYHHYGSKSGLFGAVAASLQAQVSEAVVAAADAAGVAPMDQLRAGSHAFLDAITSGHTARVLLIDAPVVIGWQEWRRLDAEHSAAHLREALADVDIAPELVDATSAQLSGAMNEAALWVVQQDDVTLARARSHVVLDHLIDSYGS